MSCPGLPPCVTDTSEQTSQWSDWSDWEVCSAKCGGGVQLRRRRCESVNRQNTCIGCDVEWRICNRHECGEVKQQSEWTEWLIKNITADGVTEQRMRFVCRTLSADAHNINIQSKVEDRFVPSNGGWSQCSEDTCNGWQFKWNGTHYIRFVSSIGHWNDVKLNLPHISDVNAKRQSDARVGANGHNGHNARTDNKSEQEIAMEVTNVSVTSEKFDSAVWTWWTPTTATLCPMYSRTDHCCGHQLRFRTPMKDYIVYKSCWSHRCYHSVSEP